MHDNPAHQPRNFWNTARIIIGVTILFVLLWIFTTINVLNNNYKLQRQVDSTQLDNQVMELENQNLELEKMYYGTDEYLELSARSLLGRAQPGEKLVILPKSEHRDDASFDGRAVTVKSNLDQWLDFLFAER